MFAMISKNKGQIFLSLLVLAASLVFFGWCWWINHASLEELTPYHAKFSSVDGLSLGAPVFVKGVSVGKVKKISLNKIEDNAEIVFSLQTSLGLPEDSTLSLSKGMTGESSLVLEPGKSKIFVSPNGLLSKTVSQPSLEQKISNFAFGSSVSD